MTKNPYGSADIGATTFRDVKNFICASLDMHGLCDDDYGMELLVAGRIVSLDLAVADVYERVWRVAVDARRRERDDAAARDDDGEALGARSSLRRRLDDDADDDDSDDVPVGVGIGGANDSPMTVTYRLQGLDGEATEEMISSVEKAEVDEADPEETYADTALLRRRDGLRALLALVPLLSGGGAPRPRRDAARDVTASTRTSSSSPAPLARLTVGTADTCAALMRLLTAAAEVSLNRRALLDAGALPALLAEASRIFSVEDDAARERGNELLLLVERLLREEAAAREEKARARAGGLSRSLSRSFAEALPREDETVSDESANDDDDAFVSEASESADDVRVFLGKLAELTSSGQRAAADTLARVLPRLAAADAAATETLARHVAVSVARLRRLDEMPAGPAATRSRWSCDVRRSSPRESPTTPPARGFDRVCWRGARSEPSRGTSSTKPSPRPPRERGINRRESGPKRARDQPCRWRSPRSEDYPEVIPRRRGRRPRPRLMTKPRLMTRPRRRCDDERGSFGRRSGARDASPNRTVPRELEPLTLLELLHALESTAEHGVGTAAENALEALEEAYDDARVAVEALRRATRAESMRKAMERRERMLREMGLTRLSPAGGDDPAGSVSGAATPFSASTPPNSTPAGSLGSWPASPSPGRASDLLAVAVSPGSMLGFEDFSDEEDEEGALVCRVCREGYKSRPRELLGVYCFCKRVERAAAAGGGGGGGGGTPSSAFAGASSAGYSSVSHFNAIHFSCHAAARRADIALRTPKREWEGAALRNSETLTNNLLPVAGLESGAEAYARAVESWWENLAAAGRPEPPSARLRLALGDVAMLLGRFAVGASFSADCHGGGRESNASAIPALLRLAAHELHTAREEENLGGGEGGTNNNLFDGVRRASAAWASMNALARGDASNAASSGFPAGLILSLLTTPRDEWVRVRRCALRAAAMHAAREGTSVVDAAAREGTSGEMEMDAPTEMDAFAVAKPMLVYVGLVNTLVVVVVEGRWWWRRSRRGWWWRRRRGGEGGRRRRRTRDGVSARRRRRTVASPSSGVVTPSEDPVSSSSSTSAFAAAARVRERLQDIPAMLAAGKEMLEWLEEAEEAEDAMELFDIMECLADVLTEGTESCDAFLKDATTAAR